MSAAPSWRSTNVAMYDAPIPCIRCGVLRTSRRGNCTKICASCWGVERTKPKATDDELALTGGHWQADSRGIQRWVAA